jgi:hypothetical protein
MFKNLKNEKDGYSCMNHSRKEKHMKKEGRIELIEIVLWEFLQMNSCMGFVLVHIVFSFNCVYVNKAVRA